MSAHTDDRQGIRCGQRNKQGRSSICEECRIGKVSVSPIIRRRMAGGIRLSIFFLYLGITACGGAGKSSVNAVLDARDAAITTHNISAYSGLILPDYMDHGRSKVEVVAQMIHLFNKFDRLDMHSFDRQIYLVDGTHADCAQSYRLRVCVGGHWRKMVQREELSLKRTPAGWKISGGL